jgi:hypothetical protein
MYFLTIDRCNSIFIAKRKQIAFAMQYLTLCTRGEKMKLVIVSAAVAIVASILTTWGINNMNQADEAPTPEIDYEQILERLDVNNLSASMQPDTAAWIRRGAGVDSLEQKILANAANSACFLTHVEIGGIQGPEDENSCEITLDDFTGFWQVTASTGENTQSELYCNARCIVWE